MSTIRFCVAALAASLAMASFSTEAADLSGEAQLVNGVKQGPHAKIGPLLGNLYDEYSRSNNKSAFKTSNPALKVRGGFVGVDLYATDAVALRRALAAMGATKLGGRGPLVSAQV